MAAVSNMVSKGPGDKAVVLIEAAPVGQARVRGAVPEPMAVARRQRGVARQ